MTEHTFTNRGDAKARAAQLRENFEETQRHIDWAIDEAARISDALPEILVEKIVEATRLDAAGLDEAARIEADVPDPLECRDCGIESDFVRDDWELREGTPLCHDCCSHSIGGRYPDDWRIDN